MLKMCFYPKELVLPRLIFIYFLNFILFFYTAGSYYLFYT